MNSFDNTPGDYQSEVGPLPARFWLYFLLLVALAALLLPACHRPTPAATAPTVVGGLIERDSTGLALDTPKAAGPHGAPPVWGADASAGRARLFGLFGKRATQSNAIEKGLTQSNAMPRKCKGCVFNNVLGNQSNTTAGKKAAAGAGATAGDTKAKGSSVIAQDSGTATALTGAGNLSNVKGDGNTTSQTKQDTTHEAAGWGAALAAKLTGPLGWVVGLAAAGLLGYGVYRLWPVLVRRKSDQA